jgi:hypothetical protein
MKESKQMEETKRPTSESEPAIVRWVYFVGFLGLNASAFLLLRAILCHLLNCIGALMQQ